MELKITLNTDIATTTVINLGIAVLSLNESFELIENQILLLQ